MDSAWEQEKPEARKMLENAAESHTSGAPMKMGESHHFLRENALWPTQVKHKNWRFFKKKAHFSQFTGYVLRTLCWAFLTSARLAF